MSIPRNTITKMNPEVKPLFLTALRSGKYEQGAGFLNRETFDEATGKPVNAMCCLGVLCEVAVANGLDIQVSNDNEFVRYEDETAYLPRTVAVWAGLNDVGDFPGDSVAGNYTSLVEANDDGMTFEEIAQIIEELF